MRRMTLGILAALALTGTAAAQYPFGGPHCFAPSVRFAFSSRNLHITGYISPAGYRVYSPYMFTPYVLPAGFMSKTVIITQPRVVAPAVNPAALLPNLPTVPPLEEREDVIVIRPRAGGVRNLPPPRAGVAKARKADKPFDPPPMLAPRAKGNAADEAARHVQLSKESFAAMQYGRALERFEHAARLTPNDGLPHFLKAQAEFALGKYADAAASVLAGLKLRPDWPKEKFSPRELYGRNVAEAALHLDQLRQAVEANPNEPALLFLYGYELWFDGRRREAKEYFQRALPMVADPKPIERFLQEPG